MKTVGVHLRNPKNVKKLLVGRVKNLKGFCAEIHISTVRPVYKKIRDKQTGAIYGKGRIGGNAPNNVHDGTPKVF